MKAKPKSREPKNHLRASKSDNFLQKIRESNSMVQYFTELRIMNPAAQLTTNLNEPRREGGFVRLAHARDEFTAPIITKGKSVLKSNKTSGRKTTGEGGSTRSKSAKKRA